MGQIGWDRWDTLQRNRWIRRHKFDVIHTVDTRPAVSLPALLGRKAAGAAWVADLTDWWGRGGATSERDGWLVKTLIGPLDRLFEEMPRSHADGTVVTSPALRRRSEAMDDRAHPVARTARSQGAITHTLEVFHRTTIAALRAVNREARCATNLNLL